MQFNPIAVTLRARKLGVLLKDARLAAGLEPSACAQAIGVSEEEYSKYEMGENSPSLPELELLAYNLNVPLEHFWGDQALSATGSAQKPVEAEFLIPVRQRIIGALIRKSRLEAGLSIEQLAERLQLSPQDLEAYEFGEAPVPLPILEAFSELLTLPLQEFQDHHGPIGAWAERQRMIQEFLDLPEEMQAFVARPVNRPYLELAQRLSEMSVDKLRGVAEGLLEITL